MNGRKVASATTSLVNVLIYESEIMVWSKKEKSSIRAVQMDNAKVSF